jgi:uroporphyrinogen-III synthase
MRILLTRPQEEVQDLAQRLRDLGHDTIVSPLMKTAPLAAVPPQLDCDGVVATSARAFRFCDAGMSGNNWSKVPLFCVGERTAGAAVCAGFSRASVVAPSVAELLASIGEHLSAPARLIYLAGRNRKPSLEDGLRAAGYDVRTLVVYETAAVDALEAEAAECLATGALDAAMHFSRRSAELFASAVHRAGLAGAAAGLRHVCISADAAKGLEALQPGKVAIASTPDTAAMIAVLSTP